MWVKYYTSVSLPPVGNRVILHCKKLSTKRQTLQNEILRFKGLSHKMDLAFDDMYGFL